MAHILHLDFTQQNWQPHPTIQGIETRFFATGQPVVDILTAKVEVGQVIGWHVHAETCEVAYVLQGQGQLSSSETETHEEINQLNINVGSAVLVPAGLWHTLRNTGTDMLILFALHTLNL